MNFVSKMKVVAAMTLAVSTWAALGDSVSPSRANTEDPSVAANLTEVPNSAGLSFGFQDQDGDGQDPVQTPQEATAAIANLLDGMEDHYPDPALYPIPSLTEDGFNYYRDSLEDLANWCQILGIDLAQTQDVYGEQIPIFDLTLPTHAEFLANEAAHLLVFTDGQASTGAQYLALFDPTVVDMVSGPHVNLFIVKIMALLGVSPAAQKGFIAAVKEVLGSLPGKLTKAVDRGKYRKAGRIVKRMMGKIISKTFARALAKHLGRQASGKILAKLSSKFIPFIGWAIFIGGVIWEVVDQLRS
ncbi:MAG: hypothetical protein V3W41_08525 [Planctomycetota bacterium]